MDGLSFRIDAGELVGLIGPNGSGKTTLANLICGALPLTSGDIIFRGKSIRGLKDHQVARLGIARTFQVTRPFTRLTVQANVAVGAMFSGPYLGRDEAFARADETLARVGLAGKARHSGAQLTVADRKRLELARALVQNPTLLILDEAMAGLNLHEIDVVIDLVREINRQGVTIIVVEHVMKVIMVLCQRVIVLHHGRKLAEGSPAEIAADDGVIREYLGARYLRSQ
ncbi:MAG TPA: ABC transporter ATP-binding protein [Chloroflexota bacterium]|nr:ABC transporter ATP-binding protein [Chloroflexota bacterium]